MYQGLHFGKVAEKQEETLKSTEEYKKEYDKVLDTFSKLEQGFNSLYSAMDEFNENGTISATTLKNLVDNDLIKYLDIVNGQLVLNEEEMINEANATKENAKAKLQLEAATKIAKIIMQDMNGTLQATNSAGKSAAVGTKSAADSVIQAASGFLKGTISVEAFGKALNKIGAKFRI